MQIRNVGVVSPGDMGQAIARRLKESGLAVHAALDGRSERTKALAREAGLADCGSMEKLVSTCELVISVINPGEALNVARQAAAAIKATRRKIAFADLNAVSPQTARDADRMIRDAGGLFIDGGIIGPPPRGDKDKPRIYVSGPDAYLFEQVNHPNILVRMMSERVGDASGVKMCYAAMTKGTTALAVELLMAARKLGVEQALEKELRESRNDVFEWQMKNIAVMPPKAYRWVPEMQEIAKTFGELGLTRRIFEGATDMYERVAATPLGKESPEQARKVGRTGLDVTRELADGKQRKA
ncbi:MAG: NAD(P)-dependent oxidoreductase [Betaproteobacteria bacterium]|nr:NAD(P)-dependent oxidoreductase [Betaproteobacteria bacterium]